MFGANVGKQRINSVASKPFEEKSLLFGLLNVTVVKSRDTYRASLKDQEEIWGEGKTRAEALGDMVDKHPAMFGLAVEEKKSSLPDMLGPSILMNFDYASIEKRIAEALKIPKDLFMSATSISNSGKSLKHVPELSFRVSKSRVSIDSEAAFTFKPSWPALYNMGADWAKGSSKSVPKFYGPEVQGEFPSVTNMST